MDAPGSNFNPILEPKQKEPVSCAPLPQESANGLLGACMMEGANEKCAEPQEYFVSGEPDARRKEAMCMPIPNAEDLTCSPEFTFGKATMDMVEEFIESEQKSKQRGILGIFMCCYRK